MTSPDQLRPACPTPTVTLTPIGDTSLVRSTHDRIGAPHHWSSLRWTDEQWDAWMRTPGLRHWLIEAATKVAGLTSLQADLQQDDMQISIFGLIPDFVGRAHGGHALTLSTRLA